MGVTTAIALMSSYSSTSRPGTPNDVVEAGGARMILELIIMKTVIMNLRRWMASLVD